MSKGRVFGAFLFAICLVGLVWRVIETNGDLSTYEQEQEQLQKRKEAEFNATRSSLNEELKSTESEIGQAHLVGEEGMRNAQNRKRVAVAAAARAERERKQAMDDHWFKRWLPGSDTSKLIVALDEKIEASECNQHRAQSDHDVARRRMERQIAALGIKKSGLEQQLAALTPPQATERTPRSWLQWLRAFLGLGTVPLAPGVATTAPGKAASAPTAAPAEHQLPRVYSYGVPDVKVGPAPVRATTAFEILDARSASELARTIADLTKEGQSIAIRLWTGKEKGTLVDLTIGCKKVTVDSTFGEAVWRKYQYFLAQTDAQCEIAPTSTFRDVFKQIALKDRSKPAGPPVAHFLMSNHTIGIAIDEGPRCQNQPPSEVPFDFDEDGKVIWVKLIGRQNAVSNAVHEPVTKAAIIRKRRAEFWGDFQKMSSAGGDVQRWEADQYEAALHELLGFPSGMGIYGAHVMSFEAGLKAGLVGAFCSVKFDPLHSERSIGGSTAECAGKLGGAPQCYRVDGRGKPDCWRRSKQWEAQVEQQRRRYWGARYEALYGGKRLDRYMQPGPTGTAAQR